MKYNIVNRLNKFRFEPDEPKINYTIVYFDV